VQLREKARPRRDSTPSATGQVLVTTDLSREYTSASGTFTALSAVNLGVQRGELVAIVGRSGSGKSTLMNLVAGIDRPTRGTVVLEGTPLGGLDERALSRFRGKRVGVVFQFFQLLPTLTMAENVMLPMDLCRSVPAAQRRERALSLLETVGIADQADKMPSALSGGQQQRAAIARALANEPALLVADEPTGNLDRHTSDDVLGLFQRLAASGTTILMVTHEQDISRIASRVVRLEDGRVTSDERGAARG
jgi:putative ABC transport system ATP-binding protein